MVVFSGAGDDVLQVNLSAVGSSNVKIQQSDSFQSIEVNTGGEFKGLMSTTDVDIAGAIVDEALRLARVGVA